MGEIMKVENLKFEALPSGQIMPVIGSMEATKEELEVLKVISNGVTGYLAEALKPRPKIKCGKQYECTDHPDKCSGCANNEAKSLFTAKQE